MTSVNAGVGSTRRGRSRLLVLALTLVALLLAGFGSGAEASQQAPASGSAQAPVSALAQTQAQAPTVPAAERATRTKKKPHKKKKHKHKKKRHGKKHKKKPVRKPAPRPAPIVFPKNKPNVVFILADDLSANELQYMPTVQREIFNRGATFDHYYANVSLCCSARASIFTGKYAHNTGIVSNVWPGGFYGFEGSNLATQSFAYQLKQQGYLTSLMGKYLNGYVDDPYYPGPLLPATYVPQGWSDWAVPTRGQYWGTDYDMNVNGQLLHLKAPENFLSDYTSRRAVSLISTNTHPNGLMLEMSDYGPHDPSPSSPVERTNKALLATAASMYYPRTPNFDEADVSDKPLYNRNTAPLTSDQVAEIDSTWRKRFLSVKSLDRHVANIVAALRATNQLDNTYFVFASDNGFHLGEHRLPAGKNSEYDTDIALPFAISGPGITPGTHVSQVVGNIDIAPTILAMAGQPPAPGTDGESMLPLARGASVPWRRDYFIQKGIVTPYDTPGGVLEPGSDEEQASEFSTEEFIGAVDERWRYIAYDNGHTALDSPVNGRPFKIGETAFYDTLTDPGELDNITSHPRSTWTPEQVANYDRLHAALLRLVDCHGAADCRVQD